MMDWAAASEYMLAQARLCASRAHDENNPPEYRDRMFALLDIYAVLGNALRVGLGAAPSLINFESEWESTHHGKHS